MQKMTIPVSEKILTAANMDKEEMAIAIRLEYTMKEVPGKLFSAFIYEYKRQKWPKGMEIGLQGLTEPFKAAGY
jgi:hypothetical protein